ncbi:hypothetical protein DBV08_05685 [Rhodococcus sp. KBW08]|nr:hypothetical protein DBV08_05685 [Rhodococcus sp. KBW08]
MTHRHLRQVIDVAETAAARLEIPTTMVTLHRDLQHAKMPDGRSLRGPRQHSLRWGAFLLVYGQIEGFFGEVLGYRDEKNRTLPLNPDKIRDVAMKEHAVDLFSQNWGLRTRTLRGKRGNRSDWETYIGTRRIGDYLSDMKSLRNLLTHGGDPSMATNGSGAFWLLQKKRNAQEGDDDENRRVSMRLMGVEGFIQASTDLMAQTILAYGGSLEDVPDWPEPERSKPSTEEKPNLPLIP